ncbi:MAG: preprotein translocase subunit SecG [Bdellovibrionota bacterium]
MITFLAIIHIIACLGLVGLVLIQDSKGGGVFTSQGSSSSVLGAGGATSLAQTMTKVIAGVFAATCIGLSIMSARSEKSVVDTMLPVTPPAATAPATTEDSTAAAAQATPAPNDSAGASVPATNEKK